MGDVEAQAGDVRLVVEHTQDGREYFCVQQLQPCDCGRCVGLHWAMLFATLDEAKAKAQLARYEGHG